MPNWVNMKDLYNNTTENFNPYDWEDDFFNERLFNFYFPYENCTRCTFDSINPFPQCLNNFNICKLRYKICEINTYPYILTKAFKNIEGSIVLRTLQWNWQYLNKDIVKFILRPCQENNLIGHHIDGNPLNNNGTNSALVNEHGYIEDIIRWCKKGIKDSSKDEENYKISAFNKHRNAYEQILKNMQSGHVIEDSVYAWKIINIVNPVIDGNRHWRLAQEMLEDIGAAYPMTDVVKNKGYYHGRNKKSLLKSKKFCEDNNLTDLLDRVDEEISKRK